MTEAFILYFVATSLIGVHLLVVLAYIAIKLLAFSKRLEAHMEASAAHREASET